MDTDSETNEEREKKKWEEPIGDDRLLMMLHGDELLYRVYLRGWTKWKEKDAKIDSRWSRCVDEAELTDDSQVSKDAGWLVNSSKDEFSYEFDEE